MLTLVIVAMIAPLVLSWAASNQDGAVVVSQTIIVSKGRAINVSSSIVILSNKSVHRSQLLTTSRQALQLSTVATMKFTPYFRSTETIGIDARFISDTANQTRSSSTVARIFRTPLSTAAASRPPSKSPGFLAIIVAGLRRGTTASSRPPANEMFQEAFQIDDSLRRFKRALPMLVTLAPEPANNGTSGESQPDHNVKVELLLFAALVLLALSALMAYSPQRGPSIRLQPGHFVAVPYQKLPSSDQDELKRQCKFSRDQSLVKKSTPKLVNRSTSPARPQSSAGTAGFEPSAESHVGPYTTNFVINDIPRGMRKLLLKVQLRRKSPQGSTRTQHKEMTFDLDTNESQRKGWQPNLSHGV